MNASSVGHPQHQQRPVAGCGAVEADMEALCGSETADARRDREISAVRFSMAQPSAFTTAMDSAASGPVSGSR